MQQTRRVCQLGGMRCSVETNLESAAAGPKGKSTSGKVNMEELIGNTDGFADSGFACSFASK